jgi:hypothetical protein
VSIRDYWAYDFATADHSLERMLAAFNAAGPWQWSLGDSGWYGDYLKTRPVPGLRVRVHQYPQRGDGGVFSGLRDRGFSALLQTEDGCPATQAEVDTVFRGLLTGFGVMDVTEIEPYD